MRERVHTLQVLHPIAGVLQLMVEIYLSQLVIIPQVMVSFFVIVYERDYTCYCLCYRSMKGDYKTGASLV